MMHAYRHNQHRRSDIRRIQRYILSSDRSSTYTGSLNSQNRGGYRRLFNILGMLGSHSHISRSILHMSSEDHADGNSGSDSDNGSGSGSGSGSGNGSGSDSDGDSGGSFVVNAETSTESATNYDEKKEAGQMETEEKAAETATSPTKVSGNDFINMFAADDRKAPIVTVSSPSKYKKSIIKSALAEVSNEEIKNAGKTMGELRAEVLRLEAEKDQLTFDKQKLEQDRTMMCDIDNFIVNLLDVLARDPEESKPSMEGGETGTDAAKTVLDRTEQKGEEFMKLVKENKALLKKELFFRLAELASSGLTEREQEIYWKASDRLMQYIKETEVSLYNSLNKDMDREVDNEINNLANMIGSGNDEMRIYDQIQNKWVQLDGPPIDRSDRSNDAVNTNTTTTPLNPWKDAMENPPGKDGMGRTTVRFPAALPITMLSLILRAPEISKQDFDILKKTVFTDDILNSSLTDYGTFLATFRYFFFQLHSLSTF